MRQLTWKEIRLLRSDQWSRYARQQEARRPKDKARRKLRAGQRARMVDALALILRRAEPTPFALEGTMRAHLRARFCLKGWGWTDADRAAEEVIEASLNQIGAVRPTWKQGQPEWTQDGVVHVPNIRCVHCGKMLPDGHRKYCGPVCAAASINRAYYRFMKEERDAELALVEAEKALNNAKS